MNILLFVAGVLAFAAFLAHASVGDKEYRALKPDSGAAPKVKETWVQAGSGWHWVGVYLFFSGCILILMATSEVIKAKTEISYLFNLYYLFCGVVWLGSVVFSKTESKKIWVLGQWIFCFLLSGLIYVGAK